MNARCVALTGGTGFIGPYLVGALTTAGWQVRLLVRPGRGRPVPDGTEVVSGDLGDGEALDRLLDGADTLVHAAGAIKGRSRRDFLATNRDGARRLAEMAARRNPALRVVVLSSLAAREPDLSDYAFSKAAGEQAFRASSLADLAILRPAAVYGPGDRETGRWLRAALGPVLPIPRSRSARLCLIHAADVAAAVTALCLPASPRGIFELSDRRADGYGWRELAETALRASGRNGRIVEIPPPLLRGAAWASGLAARLAGRAAMLTPGKAREILHSDWSSAPDRQPPPSLWRPRWTLEEGLARTMRELLPAGSPTTCA